MDGSFHSELASGYAIAIAASCNCELVVLAVDNGEVEREVLSNALDRVCQHARKEGIHARGVIREGGAVKNILDILLSQKMPTCWSWQHAAAIAGCSLEVYHNNSCLRRRVP